MGRWIVFYNQRRPHSALGDRTPNEAYAIAIPLKNLAA
jgi:transposase InsO family protein